MIKVLLVEDNPHDALLMRRMLNGAAAGKCDMTLETCMADATRYLLDHTVDVVILDLGLPDASGLAAVRQMLAAAPLLPVVVLTGRNDDQLATQALRAGAQDFLVKGEIAAGMLLRALRYAIERKSLEEKLFLEQERGQVTLNSIGDAVVCTDNAGLVTFFNLTAEGLTGLTMAEAIGEKYGERLAGQIDESLHLTDESGVAISLRPGARDAAPPLGAKFNASAMIRRANGQSVAVDYNGARILGRDGAGIGAVYVLRDMTAPRALAAKMAHLAQHDSLTGLPNRVLLTDRIRRAIAIAPRHARQPGLDGFKHVNDSLGHLVGDQLLQSVASRLTACVRGSDTVSRLGGDEFVVLLAEMARPEDAATAAVRMLEAVGEPHLIDEHELHITTSIGISLYPDDGADAGTLIKNADTAMYQAKAQGRKNYRFFEPAMNFRAVERQAIEEGLRRAAERNELSLHFQPKVDLANRSVRSAEALIRWRHPVLGDMPPVKFISVAEDCGLIVPLGRWVLREACAQAKAWIDAGMALDTMAVNVSAMEFQNERFLDEVLETLAARAGIDRKRADEAHQAGGADPERATRRRRAAGDRRFWHRVFQPELSDAVSGGYAENRPVLHPADQRHAAGDGHYQRGAGNRPQPAPARGGGRRGDGQRAGVFGALRLRRGAGVLFQRATAGRRVRGLGGAARAARYQTLR